MTILFWSDVHLDAVTSGVPRFEELGAVLDVIEDHAMKPDNGVDTVVFGGDLTDPSPEGWGCLARALGFDHRLRKAGKRVLWLVGNHDVVEDGRGSSTLAPLRGAGGEVIDQPTVIQLADGWRLGFLPFAPRALAYNPSVAVKAWASKVPQHQPDVVFGHLNLKDAVPGSETHDMPRGREVQWPLDELRALFPDARLYGGHYHAAGEINGVHIVGSPALFTFSEENNEPGFLLIGRSSHQRVRFAAPFGAARFRSFDYDPDTRCLYYRGKKYKRPESAAHESRKLADQVARAFVRVRSPSDFSDSHLLVAELMACGAHSVRVEVVASDVAPAAPTDVVLETASDGFEEAKRLADEWATADPELKQAIADLVRVVGDECFS